MSVCQMRHIYPNLLFLNNCKELQPFVLGELGFCQLWKIFCGVSVNWLVFCLYFRQLFLPQLLQLALRAKSRNRKPPSLGGLAPGGILRPPQSIQHKLLSSHHFDKGFTKW